MARPTLPHRARAACHPLRWAVDGDRCTECRWAREPTIIPANGEAPEACPRCHAASGWHGDQHYRKCTYCGEDWEHRARLIYA